MATATDTPNPSDLHPFTDLHEARSSLSRQLGKLDDDGLYDLRYLSAAFHQYALLFSEHDDGLDGKAFYYLADRLLELSDDLTARHDEIMRAAKIVCANDLDALAKQQAYLESVGAKGREGER